MKSSHKEKEQFVFVLAETEMELIPHEILSERSVVATGKERGKKTSNLILDASYHHSAMKELKEGERRGRPDIAHFFLMMCLDSRLNQMGKLKTIIHTRNDERISISPETRLPPSYHRFIGLMENLFQNRVVPSKDNPLLRIENGWLLNDVLRSEKCERIIILDSDGTEESPEEIFESKKTARTAIVIGGFPNGSLHSELSSLETEKLSLGKEMLKVWTVASEMLIAAYNSITKP